MSKTVGSQSSQLFRIGYTLIELTAALALAAMLMVAVLGVLNSLTLRQRVLLSDSSFELWHDRFTAQLEWDLTNSREIHTITSGIELAGFAGIDRDSNLSLPIPSTIRYFLESSGSKSVLVRQEIHLDADHTANCFTDLVGVETGGLILLNASEDSSFNEIKTRDKLNAIADGNIPAQVTAILLRDETEVPVYRHTFIIR